ncbi:BaiN/RdsA family NAD(P)/FAD-dependent oxidoreductase [Larsenimonas rhizosphaerae]|uniref:Aminoacetone oxidase family FAD-binding enzyme n=1 Tax=Larsenimonas rhizosphaerae TaxID=2944682 RepID=A0AA42CY29_9GAMM|nr:aminoacetone oxidase family FAD-binding enzyme [Larsenimonas rhizosphaerae]MCX2524618.1 aminoacetone oxidase family FAD-binding enzyme [Larsenimonas rhizosphaerae]
MTEARDIIVIGAGAAGLMCAAAAAYRGHHVQLLDHANKAAKKILMSGGGRCNFTNLNSTPADFFSDNPYFCISALKRYTPRDFLELVERHGISYVEKEPGQLFCEESSRDIANMLLTECEWAGVTLSLSTTIASVTAWEQGGYRLETSRGSIEADAVVVATGGLSIPTMGATGFGYDLARQFGVNVLPVRAALVPFTFSGEWKTRFSGLSGLAVPVEARCGDGCYREPVLMTHRGLSGPSMLKLSTHWREGEDIVIDWFAGQDVLELLKQARAETPRRQLQTWLKAFLPHRLAAAFSDWYDMGGTLAALSNAQCLQISQHLSAMFLKPSGTEGWRTAEVTLGGVDTREVSSKTFEAVNQPGLYFIGEVLDVTGQLGGHNFQWAWASGVACGRAL